MDPPQKPGAAGWVNSGSCEGSAVHVNERNIFVQSKRYIVI